ncbi:unnamed protein product [Didymodactylos carnosus]|uniref:AIG1-type G domain-containing protein n=1 Tax=Didymodactylos carnosus TaxID=1234261 RepID=A0A815ELQ7_9BILA|nr:unnamed protein product [Didymodactylos carnosus]CAF4152492.1 unnamed protein product [Didymodactylos carnosus]
MSLREIRTTKDAGASRKNLLGKITTDYETHGEYKMEQAKSKNVIIIGRTRSGKSTIKSLLLNPAKVSDELTLKSGTRDPHIESFHITEIGATINIIDTPGLFERGDDKDAIRDNEAILNTIKKCANMEITSFSVICFCVAITVGINGDDVKSIELLVKFLGDEISSNSCLVVTHCESKNQEQRNKIKEELREDSFFKQIATFFKLGVFFSGSINRDNYNNGNECVLDEYVTICEYRSELIKLFTADLKPFPITESQISDIRRANTAKQLALNELENTENKCKEQAHINEALLMQYTIQIHTIEDLQRQHTEKLRSIERLQRESTEQNRTIRALETKCQDFKSKIEVLNSHIEEEQLALSLLLESSPSRGLNALEARCPNIFCKYKFSQAYANRRPYQ